MNQNDRFLFDLIQSEIIASGLQTSKTIISFELFESMYETAKKHDIAQLIYSALKRNCLLPVPATTYEKKYLKDCNQRYYYSVYYCSKLVAEKQNISAVLCKAGIKHLFLKGAVLRDMYP